MIEHIPRFFAMARCPGIGGEAAYQPTGWYVCDVKDQDPTKLARPIHDDPMSMVEARELARQMNEDD